MLVSVRDEGVEEGAVIALTPAGWDVLASPLDGAGRNQVRLRRGTPKFWGVLHGFPQAVDVWGRKNYFFFKKKRHKSISY